MFAIAMGALVAAVQRGDGLGRPLAVIGVVFVLLQVLTPIQTAVSHNLGDRTAAWLYDRLTRACVRPPGMAHLEDPTLTADLTVARDFDLGMTGPPLSYSMDFIAGGLVGMIGGLAAAAVLFGFAWWAPLVLAGGVARRRTGCCARARSGTIATPTRCAARSATPTTPIGSPSIRRPARSCGCSAWSAGRSSASSADADAAAPAAVRGDAAARAAAGLEPAARHRRQRRSSSGRWRRRRPSGRLDLGGARRLRAVRGRHVAHRVRRAQLGARRRGGAGGRRRRGSSRRWPRRRAGVPAAAGRGPAGARDPLSRRRPSPTPAAPPVLERLRPHDSRRLVARHRRTERRRQDDARQAAVPAATTRRPARSRSTASTCASSIWRRGVRA